MLRLRLKLRYNGWDAGTAAAGEPGARVEGENMKCVFRPTPSRRFISAER